MPIPYPDKEKFLRDAGSYPVIPVFLEMQAEFETPVSIYLKSGGMFLLESIERGEHVGRYSIIARGRQVQITLRDFEVEILERGQPILRGRFPAPMEEIRKYFAGLKAPSYEGLPPFSGGAIGYLGYEAVRYFENVPVLENDGPIPDGCLVIPEMVLVHDSVKKSLVLVASVFPGPSPEAAYERALTDLREAAARIDAPVKMPEPLGVRHRVDFRTPVPKKEFLAGIERIKGDIRRGAIIQAVLSQPFEADLDVAAFSVYRSLRIINPSPYMFFLDFGDFTLAGSSPEVMVRVEGGEIMMKPIAGTRKRGRDPADDDRLARDLLADAKERAEHLMLVDLARNDVGRVAEPGTVEVVNFMNIEKYSHVMHLVSTVKAGLARGFDVFDVLAATFPAGTLTGAPKIQAMKIIAEVERRRRGPYGGIVFNLGFNGHFDSCITIRTIQVAGGKARVQAGAGIVADSVPESEYEESVNKARALFQAAQNASRGGSHGPSH